MKRIIIITIGAVIVAVLAGLAFSGRDQQPKINQENTSGQNKKTQPADGNREIDGDRPQLSKKSGEKADFLAVDDGWEISYFAKNLGKPRVVAFDSRGVILVSIPASGKVVALPDRNHDGTADETLTVADRLNEPHGLAFRNRQGLQLYVAETDKISVFDYDADNMKASNKKKLLDLPSGQGHSTRTLLYLPDQDKLLVSVGSSCNVCNERDERRAAVLVMDPDGSNVEIYASGLRNSVFLARHPGTGEVWATDNGRDYLGDNLPPDEINILREGGFYGWPYAYGKMIQDTSFNNSSQGRQMTERSLPSQIDIQAHSAALGLDFLGNDLYVAYHGSWNRSEPTGYKVVRYLLDEKGNAQPAEDFITGFRQGGEVTGRPVAVVAHDGALYVSDDKQGAIYLVKPTE